MDNITKYSKTKNNYQCIGPCYPANTMVIHPTQLEFVTEGPLPFCPIAEIMYNDPKTGETYRKSTDTCYNPIEKNNLNKTQIELNMLTPYVDFNPEQFLNIYYGIHSFDEAMNWIDDNQHLPFMTKLRIINSAISAFYKSIGLFDSRFCLFFGEYIKLKKIKMLYEAISKNIGIDKKTNEVLIVNESENNLDIFEKNVERTNYIVHTFLNKDELTKFLQKYFKNFEETTQQIDTFENNFLDEIANDFAIYISNKIHLTINKK